MNNRLVVARVTGKWRKGGKCDHKMRWHDGDVCLNGIFLSLACDSDYTNLHSSSMVSNDT